MAALGCNKKFLYFLMKCIPRHDQEKKKRFGISGDNKFWMSVESGLWTASLFVLYEIT